MDISKTLIRELQRDRAEFVRLERTLRTAAGECVAATQGIDRALASAAK